jgi:hypothetical protein
MDVYFNLADIPLDEYQGTDHDDSLHGQPDVQLHDPLTIPFLASKAKGLYAPLKKPVKLGSTGPGALAVHRVCWHAGVRKRPPKGFSRVIGPFGVIFIKRLQKKLGVKVDGVYGMTTHKKAAAKGYIKAYEAQLFTLVKTKTLEDERRDKIVATALFGYHNRGVIHYTQGPLRMEGVRRRLRPPSIPRWEDCSSFATWCYWVSGTADPNRLNYNGQGYTGTQINHGEHISGSNLKQGDLVFYGRGSAPSHVAVYVGSGRVVSHGSEVGPLFLDTYYRSDYWGSRQYL